jgi:hypothetical protein
MSPIKRNLRAGSLGALLALSAFAIIEMAMPKPSVAATAPRAQPAQVAAGPHVDGNHFTLDGAPAADCAVGASCVVAIKLAAQAEYHINQQYPYKFTASPAAGVTFLGADPANPNVFTKTAGDFAINDEKTATMNVKFKVAQKGPVAIGGTFKLSVCSSANCQLEQQDLSVSVTAK